MNFSETEKQAMRDIQSNFNPEQFLKTMAQVGANHFKSHSSNPNSPKKENEQKGKSQNSIFVPLHGVDPENVSINLNEQGLMTISATGTTEKNTDRNGRRKETIIIEETLQLPSYLLESDDVVETSTQQLETEEMGEDKESKSSSKKDAQKLLTKVETKFIKKILNNGLEISFPKRPEPKVVVEEEKKKDSDEPIEIKIDFV